MIVINTVSNERFSLNGIEYFKNFLSFVYGDNVGIYNAYDKTDQRVNLDLYSNFTVDGVVYESAALLQSALLGVIYTRDTLGAVNTVLKGSVKPTDTPTGTGVAFWVATQAGTYTNFGGVIVSANSFAVISRDAAGAFSISQTTFDITSKVNVSDVINTLVSTETAKPLSAAQGKALNNFKYDLNYKANVKAGKNKFDKSKSTSNAINNLNVFITNATFIYSDYIPVTVGEVYKTSRNFRYTCFFDSKYNYVAGGTATVGQSITIPSSVSYVIVTSYANEIDLFQIELGTVTTDYEAFYVKVDANQLDVTSLVPKTLIDEINPVGYILKNGSFEWIEGSINTTNGNSELVSGRIKTKNFTKIDKTKSITISKNDGYSYAIIYYNLVADVYTYVGTSNYYSGSPATWNTPLGDYIKIVILQTTGDLVVSTFAETGFVISAYFYDYMPVASKKSVDDLTVLVNTVIPFDFTKFNKAYIKNERLACNDVNSSTTAHYLGLEILTAKPQWMKAGVIWEAGTSGGVAAIIANPNGLKLVSNITSKSLHIVFTDTKFDVGVFNGAVNTVTHSYTYPTACLRDDTTEYLFGWKVDSIGLTIYAKGETIVYNSITDGQDYLDYAGKYCTFEHYYTGLGKTRPQFNWIEVKDTNNEVIYDDFNRPMGLPVQNNTGYRYTQINNS